MISTKKIYIFILVSICLSKAILETSLSDWFWFFRELGIVIIKLLVLGDYPIINSFKHEKTSADPQGDRKDADIHF